MPGAILLTTDQTLASTVESALGSGASRIRLEVCATPLQLRERVAAPQGGACAAILLDDRTAGAALSVIVRHLRAGSPSTPVWLLSHLGGDDASARAAMVGVERVFSVVDGPLPDLVPLLTKGTQAAEAPRYHVAVAGAGTTLSAALEASERLRITPIALDNESGSEVLTRADALLVSAGAAGEELAFALQRVKSRAPTLPIVALCEDRLREAMFRLDVVECLPIRSSVDQVERAVERAVARRRVLLEHAALKAREARLRALIEGFPDGVLVAGPDEVVQALNAAALELFRVKTAAEVVGKRLADVVVLEGGATPATLAAAVARGERLSVRLRPQSAPDQLLEGRAAAHHREPGKPASLLLALRVSASPSVHGTPSALDGDEVRPDAGQAGPTDAVDRLTLEAALREAEGRVREADEARLELEARLRGAEDARRAAEESLREADTRRREAEDTREHLVDVSLAEVARWQQQVETLTAQQAALVERQAAMAARAADESQERVQALRTQHEQALVALRQALDAEHAAALAARDETHEAALAAAVNAARRAVATDHATLIDQLREELTAEREQALVALRQALDAEHAAALAARDEAHEAALAAAVEAARREVTTEQTSVIERLREELTAEREQAVGALRQALDAEHAAALAARDAAHEAALAAAVDRARTAVATEHEQALLRLRQALDVAHAAGLAARDAAHEAALAAAVDAARREAAAEQASVIDRLREELTAEREQAVGSLRRALDAEHAAALAARDAAHEAALAAAVEAARGEVAAEQVTLTDQLREELTAEREHAVAALRQALDAEHAAALAARDEAHEAALAAAVEAARREVAAEQASVIERLREELTGEREQAVGSQRQALDAEHTAALAALRETLETAHVATLAARDAAHEVALSATVEAARRAVTTEHEQALLRLRQALDAEHAAALAARDEAHDAALAAAVNAARSAVATEQAAVVEQFRQTLATEHERALTAQRQALDAEHAAALAARQQAHEAALAAAVEDTRSAVTTERDQALARMRQALDAEHLAALAARDKGHRRALAEQLDQLRRELAAQHADEIVALEAARAREHAASLEALEHAIASRDADFERKLATLRAEHEASASRWRAELEAAGVRAIRLETELAANRAALTDASQELSLLRASAREHFTFDDDVRDLLNAATLGLVRTDESGRVLGATDGAARLCGHDNATDLLADGVLPKPIQDAAAGETTDGAQVFEVCVQEASGLLRWVLGARRRVPAGGDVPAEHHWMLIDRSEHYLSARRARFLRRMEALTHFLTSATVESTALLEQVGDDFSSERVRTNGEAERAKKALVRVRAIFQQLSRYAERRTRRATAVDLADVLERTTTLLTRLAGEESSCEIVAPTGNVLAAGDPAEFEDVLAKLVLAGREALPAGGRITISVVPALGSVSIGATLASQPVVMLTLAAEGYGATPILVPQSVGEIVARLGGQLATEHVETGTSTVVITVPRVVRLVAVPPQRGVLPFEPKASNL